MPFSADYYYHLHSSQDKPGYPVILLHGAGGNHLSWPTEVRRLAGYRMYALDLPGHGKSSGRGLQSIKAYADHLLTLMNGLKLSQAVIIGHSMGAAIAMTFALEYPEQVSGLGLVGAASKLLVSPELLQESGSPTTYHNAVKKVVDWSFNRATSERMRALAFKRLGETRQSVLHGDFVACNDFDLTDRVASVTVPTIIICGADDKMTPSRHSRYLASQIKNSYTKIIPDAGHMVMLEKPVEVAKILVEFLAPFRY